MHKIDKFIVVDRPVSTVYNQWTQFETFPQFMRDIEEVRQLDDTHLHWKAKLGGREKQWDAEITEQEPDRRITWKSVSGTHNAGTVRFKPLGQDQTEVHLLLVYDTEGALEAVGHALGRANSRDARVARLQELLRAECVRNRRVAAKWLIVSRIGNPSFIHRWAGC
jgi:uncharacterized membrane protein